MSEFQDKVELGDGAQFWAYVSPENETSRHVTRWEVRFEQADGNWSGIINSENPDEILQTPKLSGIFKVTVRASGHEFEEKALAPKQGSNPDIGCKSNCTAIVGIVAAEGGKGANYWTTWDAICC
ncbi:hypothetical protein MNBD_NITROSPIRAE02-596 [hydrothermal vent metagenome]|uniref:Uncharacterized protein n=1 Tax=hydrothermal vent metagenome TaxID=652676 RepID=A0A3B1CST7_9ZZZZ